jgi:hypothetical protein
VSQSGTVLAKGVGTAIITATSRVGNISRECQVTVSAGIEPVYSKDVYTSGLANDSGQNEARLWIGGVPQYLELKFGGLAASDARGVGVAPNGDVYVSGREAFAPGNSYFTCLYWKNGERFPLYQEVNTNHGLLYGSAMYGNDFYVWGTTYVASMPVYRATFWRIEPSGKITTVNMSSALTGTTSYCYGVAVSDGYVYAAYHGTTDISGNPTSVSSAKLWKAPVNNFSNPVVTELSSNSTLATTVSDIWVSDTSVYISGSLAATPTTPLLWKDGELQSFTYDTTRNATVTKGAARNANIYMVGTQAFGDAPATRAQLWTNGIPQTLSDSGGTGITTARCVFVNATGTFVGGYNNLASRNPLVWINGSYYRHAPAGGAATIEGIFVK